MATYFDLFPVQKYDLDKDLKPVLATNIMHRFKIREILRTKAVIFYTYNVAEGERPDHVSQNFYGTVTLDWLVLITNQMLDRHFEWPLHYHDFIHYLKHKYGSVRNAHQTVHHYLKVVQDETVLDDGTVLPERTIYIDKDSFDSTVVDLNNPYDEARREISCYQYEKDLNESRREIKIIHPTFVKQILGEAEKIFNARLL